MKLYEYSLPLKTGKIRKGLILKTDRGLGEIAPLKGFSKESFDEAKREALAFVYEKKAPLHASVRFACFAANFPIQSCTLPLCSLGPKEGFSTIKLKLKNMSIPDAVSYVKQYVRKAKLRLDCNKAWSLEEAIEFSSHFQPSDFEYLEEPTRTFEELVQFSKKTNFPIALDESIHHDWNQILSLKAIVVKPSIVGSIPKVKKPLQLVLSSAYESGLGLLKIASFAKKNTPIGLDTMDLFEEDLLINPIQMEKGILSWKKSDPILDYSKLTAL